MHTQAFKPTSNHNSLADNKKESHKEKPGLLEAIPNMPYNKMKDLIKKDLTEGDMETIKTQLEAGKILKIICVPHLYFQHIIYLPKSPV